MGASKAGRLAPVARALAISLFVSLPETGAVVVLVGVERPVRPRIALVGFAVLTVTHRIVAVAVPPIRNAARVAAVVPVREGELLISTRWTLDDHGARVAAAHRRARMLAVVAGPIAVGEAGAVAGTRR